MFDKKNFTERQKSLIDRIKGKFNVENGAILLFSGFEIDCRHKFRPENNFFYLTGVKEPGACAVINLEAQSSLFQPEYGVNRSIWESEHCDQPSTEVHGIDQIYKLGKPINGFSINADFNIEAVENLIEALKKYDSIFICQNPGSELDLSGLSAKWFYHKVSSLLTNAKIFNVADQINDSRRIKDMAEIDSIKKSIDACVQTHKKIAHKIKPNISELELKNLISNSYDAQNCQDKAFRSIVASGKNSTVLHHLPSQKLLKDGVLVVIDIGCEFDMYASDLTRTYPVSGKFSPRQKEIYKIVLEAQKFIESATKPGMFLKNFEKGEKSLQYLTIKFFKERGLEKYFPHGIGHYMGLDVHDVGSYKESLAPGCVFTIEPGLYLREESIGVRIEDNYLMTEKGLVRLSANLPREIDEIEAILNETK